MPKAILITGASSGIGRAAALELLGAGHTVYAGARRVESMVSVGAAGGRLLPLDVTSEADLERVVQTILEEQGRIDVLVNNAGFGLYAAAEDVPLDDARYQLEVNLFGPARLIQLVLPHMREQRAGTIVNVSSMGGEITFPLGAWYHASKHALEAYSDALRQEVKGFGIHVVLVQPGIIRTSSAASAPRLCASIPATAPTETSPRRWRRPLSRHTARAARPPILPSSQPRSVKQWRLPSRSRAIPSGTRPSRSLP